MQQHLSGFKSYHYFRLLGHQNEVNPLCEHRSLLFSPSSVVQGLTRHTIDAEVVKTRNKGANEC